MGENRERRSRRRRGSHATGVPPQLDHRAVSDGARLIFLAASVFEMSVPDQRWDRHRIAAP
jgi:hypothetical protein